MRAMLRCSLASCFYKDPTAFLRDPEGNYKRVASAR